MYVFVSVKTWLKSLKLVKNNNLDDEHYPSISVTFFGGGGEGEGDKHFRGTNGASRQSLSVGKQ